MTIKLEQAARQIIVDWDSGIHLYEAITALREALGENNGKRNLDGDSECVANHNSNNCCDSMSTLADQAEQEPILLSPSCAERGCACFDDRVDGEPVTAYLAPVQPVMQEPVACYEITQREDGEGFVVPTDEVYGLVCCDCGLSHDVVWSYDKETNELGMAAKRNDEATKQRRNAAPVSIAKQSETDSSSSLMRTTVRTKDLTDDEIYTLYSEPCSDREMVEFARAVIAADREKNRG